MEQKYKAYICENRKVIIVDRAGEIVLNDASEERGIDLYKFSKESGIVKDKDIRVGDYITPCKPGNTCIGFSDPNFRVKRIVSLDESQVNGIRNLWEKEVSELKRIVEEADKKYSFQRQELETAYNKQLKELEDLEAKETQERLSQTRTLAALVDKA